MPLGSYSRSLLRDIKPHSVCNISKDDFYKRVSKRSLSLLQMPQDRKRVRSPSSTEKGKERKRPHKEQSPSLEEVLDEVQEVASLEFLFLLFYLGLVPP